MNKRINIWKIAIVLILFSILFAGTVQTATPWYSGAFYIQRN
jgi:hypothetical protein